jgi:hypothetical protein
MPSPIMNAAAISIGAALETISARMSMWRLSAAPPSSGPAIEPSLPTACAAPMPRAHRAWKRFDRRERRLSPRE